MPALLRSPRVHTLLIAIGALIVYWALRAASFYGDGSALLFKVARGETAWLNHPLFPPLIGRLARFLARPGLPLFDAMSLLSATGAAVFAACAHRAGLRLGLVPARAAVLALLCIVTPVVVTLATVVEVPGPFLGAAGPALWLAVHLVRTPRLLVAILLGCTTGLAQGLHGSGAFLLPGLMVLLACERRAAHLPRPVLRTLADLLIAGGCHVAFLCTAIAVLRPGVPVASLWHSDTLDQALRQIGALPAWHRVLLIEWGVPFAPLSLVPLLALVIRTSNPVRLALWGLTVPALVVNTLVFREAATHGTYLIPLVFPCALWVARKLPIPLGIAIALATIPVTARNFETLQNRASVGLTQSMVADAVGDRAISAMVGEPAEAVPIVRHAPRTPWFLAESFLRNFPGYEALCAAFRAAATDSELYLTPGALDVLRGATDPAVVRFVREEFDKHYQLLGEPRAKFRLLLVRRRT